MRNGRALFGVVLCSAAFGCAKEAAQAGNGARPPYQTGAEGTSSQVQGVPATQTPTTGVDLNEIVMGTFACLLGPVIRENNVSGREASHGSLSNSASLPSGRASPHGFTRERCMMGARTAGVPANALAGGESAAINEVRRVLEASLSSQGFSPDASRNTLAFFDKGVSAAKEAGLASSALAGQAVGPLSASAHGKDDVRAHRELESLCQFGRTIGTTETGLEAQVVAWVIAVDRFLALKDVSTQDKALVAEPLFSAILNVPAPASASWDDYLATAARTVRERTAPAGKPARGIGGGPTEPAQDANLTEIVRTSARRLQMLGEKVGSPDLRAEVDRALSKLETFEAAPASKTPSEPDKATFKKPAAGGQPVQ
jgi:hypothetical protein